MDVTQSTNTSSNKQDTASLGTNKGTAQMDSGETHGLFTRTLDDIKSKKNAVEERIEQLKKAGESATKELRAGLEMAWDDLRLSLESALSQFTKRDEDDDKMH